MRKVLVIAYYFPPQGGAGVQRTLKFVKYLPQFGWQPVILTAKPTGKLQDASLLAEIPKDVAVYHTPILRLPTYLPWRLRQLITRWLLLVDEQLGWLPFAVPAGRRIINEQHIAALYTT
ncbi:MAG: glycosyl transferase family 1, partial [Anaerolineae bacterium]|nr:glycosyl transferase family 1 [Anaerolineae bacterium]